jgi:hypothetical protein
MLSASTIDCLVPSNLDYLRDGLASTWSSPSCLALYNQVHADDAMDGPHDSDPNRKNDAKMRDFFDRPHRLALIHFRMHSRQELDDQRSRFHPNCFRELRAVDSNQAVESTVHDRL